MALWFNVTTRTIANLISKARRVPIIGLQENNFLGIEYKHIIFETWVVN